MQEREIIIIPDIHGREFWKEAVMGHDDGRIIFLGDYTDPYTYEGVPQENGLKALLEVIAFKKEHPQTVTLLLGNHDLGYLDRMICECRMDYLNEGRIRHEILSNLDLFDLVCEETSETRRYLFSHAGVGTGWLKAWSETLGGVTEDPGMLNWMLHKKETWPFLFRALSDVSYVRGGEEPFGSCVWADHMEFSTPDDFLPGYFQVFGHTQGDGPEAVLDRGICLDCRRAFRLDMNTGAIR